MARAVLMAPNTGYTEPDATGCATGVIAGSDNDSSSSGVAVSSGSRPTPIRTASLPSAGHAVSIANGTASAGPPAKHNT